MQSLDLGYGDRGEIIARAPGGWTIIRDADAACVGAPCWIAYPTTDVSKAETVHETAGGTVTESFVVGQ